MKTFYADTINGIIETERDNIDYLSFEDIDDLIYELDNLKDDMYFEMPYSQIKVIKEKYGIILV